MGLKIRCPKCGSTHYIHYNDEYTCFECGFQWRLHENTLSQEGITSYKLPSEKQTSEVITAIILIIIGLVAIIGGPLWYLTWRDTPHTLEEHTYGILVLFLGLTILPLIGSILLYIGGSLLSRFFQPTEKTFPFLMPAQVL